MRRYSILILVFTLVAGGCGFYLRSYELSTAFEPLTGLAVRNAPATIFLLIMTAAFLVLSTVLAAFAAKYYSKPKSLEDAFGMTPTFYLVAYVPVWVVWICGTILYFPGFVTPGVLQTVDIYFMVTSILAAVSIILFAIGMYQDPRQKSLYPLSVAPIVFLCFWLILLYRQHASNPVLLSYVYQCLAIIAATLSFYYTAGFLYGKPAQGKAMFSYFCAIYFCCVTLADNHGIGITLIFFAVIATSAISLFLLLRNLERKETEAEGIRNF